ncbi:MAG TPA: oligosaccharide flippase family protein [Candidatus Magasanikbacteria bacterium]|nr:oligosaccharide flippase family protein [Candidatus Magasanikbacteria bacterium]
MNNNKIKEKIKKILIWSQKYTKTDMLYLAKGGFWLSTNKIISMFSSFVSSIFFANLLLPETYGTFRYILSMTGLLAVTALTGMDLAVNRAVAKGQTKIINKALNKKMQYGLIGSLGSLILMAYYFVKGNTTLATLFLISSFFIWLMDPLYLFNSVLNGLKKFKESTIYNGILKITTTIILVITIFVSKNIFLLVFMYFLSNTFLRFIYFSKTKSQIHPSQVNTEEIKETISFGKHLSAIDVINQISTYLDKILIFNFGGAALSAVYYLSLMPYKQIKNFLNSFNTLALPKFTETSHAVIKKTLISKVIKLYIIILPVIAAYIILAPWFFKVFYPQYENGVWISQIFICQLIFYPSTLFSTALTAQGDKKNLYTISTSYSIIRIILLVILIPLMGTKGAVLSLLLSGLINSISIIILFYRKKNFYAV